jgi:PAS domain S-box-containing protein
LLQVRRTVGRGTRHAHSRGDTACPASARRLLATGSRVPAMNSRAELQEDESATHRFHQQDSPRSPQVPPAELLGSLWRHSPDLLAVLDGSGHIVDANPAWLRLLGWSAEIVRGRTFQEFTAEEADLGDPSLTGWEQRMKHADGSHSWFTWRTATEGSQRYLFGRSVNVEREARASLEATRDQLRQSQKMEAVGQLTSGLAHDFNNMLTAIDASLEMAQRRLAREEFPRVRQSLMSAQGATSRASDLAQRLVAFARRQVVAATVADLNDVVTGLEDLIRRTLHSGVQLVVLRSSEPCIVTVDPNQFENALLNLCINASDAMPDGGSLMVSTRREMIDAPTAAGLSIALGDYVVVEVSDTGVGMSAETMDHVFEPFFTTKPPGHGTGLGLSMVHGFAQQSMGAATVRSAPGKGSTLTLYFPRCGEG